MSDEIAASVALPSGRRLDIPQYVADKWKSGDRIGVEVIGSTVTRYFINGVEVTPPGAGERQ